MPLAEESHLRGSMKSDYLIIAAAALSFFISSIATLAHHGSSVYDKKNPVTLKGTVTDFVWANPHVQTYFDVKDDSGKVVHWSCEAPGPGRMGRAGWTRNSVKPGDQVTLIVWPARTGVPVGFLVKLMLPDGETLLTGVEDLPPD
jgi:Family of unknown function (DUF6152)